MESGQKVAVGLAKRCRLSELTLQLRRVLSKLDAIDTLPVFHPLVELVYRLADRSLSERWIVTGYSVHQRIDGHDYLFDRVHFRIHEIRDIFGDCIAEPLCFRVGVLR